MTRSLTQHKWKERLLNELLYELNTNYKHIYNYKCMLFLWKLSFHIITFTIFHKRNNERKLVFIF